MKSASQTATAIRNAPIATWAVHSPFGVFVCIDCVGVHRFLCSEIAQEARSSIESTVAEAKKMLQQAMTTEQDSAVKYEIFYLHWNR